MAAVVGKRNPPGGIMNTGSASGKLPLVEPRPFVSEQWRPCKSMPEFYDTRSLPSTTGPSSPRKAGPGSLISDAEAEVKKLIETPRSNQGQGQDKTKKANLHPPRPQTESVSIDGEQAFATCLERQKSTVQEIKNGSSKIVFSCFRRAMSDLDLTKQQDMKICGQKMEDRPQKGTMYADPWEYYRCGKSYSTGGSVTRSLPNRDTMESLYLKLENIQFSCMDKSIYDTFDRSNTLPSINVRNAPMKMKRPRTERGVRQPSGKVTQKPGYRLGVANSLDVLSQYGRPAEVEQHISNHLRQTIKQIRKTKNLRFIDTNILPMSRYGGSYFTPRYTYSEGSEVPHQHNPDSFIDREKSQRQQMITYKNQKQTSELNLEGASVSSHSIGQTEESKMALSKRSRDHEKWKEDPHGLARGTRALIASRSSLSSSVPSAAVSARALSMMRAETLPAIAPGSGVFGFKEMTSSLRSRLMSNSAPEVRDHQKSPSGDAHDSRTSTGLMPKISESCPRSSPVSPRSSVSSVVLKHNNQNFPGQMGKNTGKDEPVVNGTEHDELVVNDTENDESVVNDKVHEAIDNKERESVEQDNQENRELESNETEPNNVEPDDTIDDLVNQDELPLDENNNVHVEASEDRNDDSENDKHTSRNEVQNNEDAAETNGTEEDKKEIIEPTTDVPEANAHISEETLSNKSPEPVVLEPFESHNEIL